MVENAPEKRGRTSSFEKERLAEQNFTDLFNELENIVHIDSSRRDMIYWVNTEFKSGRQGKAIVCLDYNFEPYNEHEASLFIWPQLRNGLMSSSLVEMRQTVSSNPDDDFDFFYNTPEFIMKKSFPAPSFDLNQVDAEDVLFGLAQDRPSDEMRISSMNPTEVQKFVGKIDINSLQKYF